MQLMLFKPSSFFTNVSQKTSSDDDFSGHFENSCKLGICFIQKGPRGISTVLPLTQLNVSLEEVTHTHSLPLCSPSFEHLFKGTLLKTALLFLQITTRSHCPTWSFSAGVRQQQELALTVKEGSSHRLKIMVSLEIYFFKHGHFEINDTTSGNMKE